MIWWLFYSGIILSLTGPLSVPLASFPFFWLMGYWLFQPVIFASSYPDLVSWESGHYWVDVFLIQFLGLTFGTYIGIFFIWLSTIYVLAYGLVPYFTTGSWSADFGWEDLLYNNIGIWFFQCFYAIFPGVVSIFFLYDWTTPDSLKDL